RLNVEKILSPEVISQFDVIVSGDETRKGKPSPEGYLQAARKLHLAPGHCFVIENAPLGIMAAKRAGMKVVALTTTLDRLYLDGADFYAMNLADLENNWNKIFN
ncbi:MAG: HAD family hydrolase, partial [bacterium]